MTRMVIVQQQQPRVEHHHVPELARVGGPVQQDFEVCVARVAPECVQQQVDSIGIAFDDLQEAHRVIEQDAGDADRSITF